MFGRIKIVFRDRGYGFITDNTGTDRFFSLRDVPFSQAIEANNYVIFEADQKPRGPIARNIYLISADGLSTYDKRVLESNSFIQGVFWSRWKAVMGNTGLIPEFPILNGKYRIDFADPVTKTAVELDGWQYHQNRAQFEQDRKRQRDLVEQGWTIIPFTGREIKNTPDDCVHQVRKQINHEIEAPNVHGTSHTDQEATGNHTRSSPYKLYIGVLTTIVAVFFMLIVAVNTSMGMLQNGILQPPQSNSTPETTTHRVHPANTEKQAVVVTPEVQVFEIPDSQSALRGVFSSGDLVIILSEITDKSDNLWYKVESTSNSNSLRGWINSKSVRLVTP